MTLPPRLSSERSILHKQRFAAVSIVLAMLLFAPLGASADRDVPDLEDRGIASAALAKKSALPQPLLPKTRYTVRRQIESIRPTDWLASYGHVEVREVGH